MERLTNIILSDNSQVENPCVNIFPDWVYSEKQDSVDYLQEMDTRKKVAEIETKFNLVSSPLVSW